MPTFTAKHIGAPIAPRKARLVADLIRGLYADEALAQLRYLPQRSAALFYKVVASAVANAANQGNEDTETLRISRVWVDESFRIKRFRPRSRGSAAPYVRARSRLCVELSSN